MKKLLLLFLILFGSHTSWGQKATQTPTKPKEKKGLIYNKEFTGGGGWHTNGFHFSADYGVIPKYYLTRYWHFEIITLKHPKEHRQTRDNSYASFAAPKSYIYGKQNSFFALNLGAGEKRYFSEKAKKNGIAVGITYAAGFSLGILKPYYLDVPRQDDPSVRPEIISIKYTPETATQFLGSAIYGASGAGYGWNEIQPIPGGFGKFGLLFDWGAFDAFAKSLEVGIELNAYYKKVPIMVLEENQPYFLNLYINLQFGKRW